MTVALLIIGFGAGALTSRTVQLAARGGLAEQIAQRAFLVVLLGGLATPALVSLLVGGFFALTWYVWLAIVVGGLLAISQIVTGQTFPLFYRISPFLNGITIAAAVAFWGDYAGLIDLN